MENGCRSNSRGQRVELAKTKENRLKVVPNQALYQAEPQPELIAISRTPVAARVLTSRILRPLARGGKRDEPLAPWCHASKIGPCFLSPSQLVPIPGGPTTSLN